MAGKVVAIRSRRIYRQIADQLAELIDAGTYPAGTCLPPERDLARQLEVSRSSVREAMIALEVLGIVDVRVGAGVFVRESAARSRPDKPGGKATRGSLMQVVGRSTAQGADAELGVELDLQAELPPFALLQARRLIEPETAALAARHASRSQLAGIEVAFQQNMEDNRRSSITHAGDRLFHIRIAEASGNAAYEAIIGLLLARRYGGMFQRLQGLYTRPDRRRQTEEEHLAILDGLRAGDAAKARGAMRRHLDKVIRNFSRE